MRFVIQSLDQAVLRGICLWVVWGGMALGSGCVTEMRVDSVLPAVKPIPAVTITPLPYDRVGFAVDERPLTVLHHGPLVRRPYLFPVIGPSGRLLTRMGHPNDPYSHSHHNSVWISHHAVDGVNFWADRGKNIGRILTDRVQRLEDGDDEASALIWNRWVDDQDRALLIERRRVAVRPLEDQQWMLLIDVQLEVPPGKDRTVIESNPFGLIGVRMAKSIGIHDGGGTIRNSEGQVDEKGDQGCFRKPARWCDYSGQVSSGVIEGITLMDHPANPNHPAPFHVRGDGWMGACLTLDKPIEVTAEKPLRVRYALYMHRGLPSLEQIDAQWSNFTMLPLPEMKATR